MQRRWPSVEKARELLGFQARIGPREGIAQTVDWLREARRGDRRVTGAGAFYDAFDAAVLSHVLEHVADPVAVLRQAARVAGTVIVRSHPSGACRAARLAPERSREIVHAQALDRAAGAVHGPLRLRLHALVERQELAGVALLREPPAHALEQGRALGHRRAGSARSALIARASACGSPGGTQRRSSRISGSDPVREAITGTPAAIASSAANGITSGPSEERGPSPPRRAARVRARG